MFRLRLAGMAGTLALSAGLSVAADYGTLKGQVKLPAAPPPGTVNVTTDQAHCLSKGPLKTEDVIVDPKTGGFKNVIVFLRPDNADRKAQFPTEMIHPDLKNPKAAIIEIDQPCCQFTPRIFVARAGDTIVVKNSSPVNHNANFTSDDEQFNQNIPPGGNKTTKPLKAQRSAVTVACNVHPWMKAVGRVFDHPYYAVTDAEGNFTIDKVPAGKWRIVYFHENGIHKGIPNAAGETIEVKAGETKLPPVDFEFKK